MAVVAGGKSMSENGIWARYYQDYARQLFRYALSRVGNHHDAEDIVAEAFVRAAKHLDRLEGNPAYLYAIARNLVNNRSRRTGRERPNQSIPQQTALLADLRLEDDPERAALLAQDREEVWQALERLTADQREAIHLRYFGELGSAEIGKIIGKTSGAIDVLTCRARLKLCRILRLAQVDAATLPERCWNVHIPRLSAHIDNQLKPSQLEETLAHLRSCQPCQAAYAAMQETGRRLRVLLPPVLALPSLSNRIETQLAASASAEEHGWDVSSREDEIDRSTAASAILDYSTGVRASPGGLRQVIAHRITAGHDWLRVALSRADTTIPNAFSIVLETISNHFSTTIVIGMVAVGVIATISASAIPARRDYPPASGAIPSPDTAGRPPVGSPFTDLPTPPAPAQPAAAPPPSQPLPAPVPPPPAPTQTPELITPPPPTSPAPSPTTQPAPPPPAPTQTPEPTPQPALEPSPLTSSPMTDLGAPPGSTPSAPPPIPGPTTQPAPAPPPLQPLPSPG